MIPDKKLWATSTESILVLLGPTGVIVPMGDPDFGHSDASTMLSHGGEQHTWTWSQSPDGFDTPFDQTDADSYKGHVPKIQLNGTDEYLTTPDDAFWTGGDASTDNAFSMGAWINMVDATKFRIMIKTNDLTPAEWLFTTDSNDLYGLFLFDDTTAAANQLRSTVDTAGTADEGKDIFVVATYDGSGTAIGVNVYRNGTLPAQTRTLGGTYVAMHDTTALVKIGLDILGIDTLANGTIYGGPLGPFFTQKVLTADEVLQIYNVGVALIEA